MKTDKLLLWTIVIISLFGLLMIFSSSYVWALHKFNDPFRYVKYQALFLIIGILVMNIVSKINYLFYKSYVNQILIVCLILLILVLIPGIGVVRNGSRSWFGIGSFGIQPSEFAKLVLIIFTSKYLEKNIRNIKKIKEGVLPIVIFTLVIFGLIMLQPDFGTGVIVVMGVVGLLFISGVQMSFFMKMGVLGMIGVTGLIIVAPYRVNRILSFLNPWQDPLGTGFQIIQSLYAIGPGGIFGFGLGNSRQKHFYLPEPQTDFIFSIISEEFGILGIIIVATLFLIIIIKGFIIARKCNDLFGKFLVSGITFQLAFQTLLNLMVVVGLIPVTGVTLPFLSYGGSSLLITLISMGIVLNVSRYQR